MSNSKIYSFAKKFSMKQFSASKHGSQETAQIARWPCEPLILMIEHFEG